MRAFLIPADAAVDIAEVEITDRTSNMAAAIGCTWVEFVTVRDPEIKMVVDEEGLLKRDAVMNARASLLYPGPTPIVGDVLLVGWDASRTAQGLMETVDTRFTTADEVADFLLEAAG